MPQTWPEAPPRAYYNENDKRLARVLQEAMDAGLIMQGDIDTRSILDIHPHDLIGYHQHHFFAGIGIWSYALKQAGWPDELPVWTGSCPCQPFSPAGKGKGFADERHLWPAWYYLIEKFRPGAVFGEQVADAGGLAWLDLVHSDMDAQNYALGAFDLCAAGFGSPQLRQRLYWVADTNDAQWRADFARRNFANRPAPRWIESNGHAKARREANGFWRDCAWADRGDGRKVGLEPGMVPLAYVDPATMVALHGSGNAIVAEQAIEFVSAYIEGSLPGRSDPRSNFGLEL